MVLLFVFFFWHQMTGSYLPVCHRCGAASHFSALVSPPEIGAITTTALNFSPFMKFINHKMPYLNWLHLQLLWVVCSCPFPVFLLAKKLPCFLSGCRSADPPASGLHTAYSVLLLLCSKLGGAQDVQLQATRSLSSKCSISTMGSVLAFCRNVYHLSIPQLWLLLNYTSSEKWNGASL